MRETERRRGEPVDMQTPSAQPDIDNLHVERTATEREILIFLLITRRVFTSRLEGDIRANRKSGKCPNFIGRGVEKAAEDSLLKNSSFLLLRYKIDYFITIVCIIGNFCIANLQTIKCCFT